MRLLFSTPIKIPFFSSAAVVRSCRLIRPSIEPSMAAIAPKSEEEGVARKLWIKLRRESVFAMYTPFAVCLASGNLKIDSFRHYIAQDLHFLKAFAQAYELAEECADDDDAKLSISELRKAVLEELKMHDSFVQILKP